MADQSMSKVRCWTAENVARTVFSDIGALAGDADAVFLAAHTPIHLEHRKGPEFGAEGSGEAQVLSALLGQVGDLERNTLVAVTGASGSGKSHVVRWVHSHLPSDDPRFHILYVPRAIQTLRELLHRIIDGLPAVDGNDLMMRVDEAISSVKPGELQARLINEIKIALDWTLEERAPFDGETPTEAAVREDRNAMLGEKDSETGGRRDGLAALLDLAQFKNALLRPEGRLSQLVQSYFDEKSRRDDHEIFTAADLPLRERGIRTALSGRRDLGELWELISRNPEDALALLEEALRVALPRTVGLRSSGGETLDSLFRASRKSLRSEGRELVLVFEDLAQFGLVDGELYDQFVTPPGDDLAPLRVLFAITDGPYQRLERTVRTRVQHEFHVGGSALSDPALFVGRYLNLVRVGREEAQALWTAGSDQLPDASWMSNACETREQGQPCRFRDTCHEAFGSVSISGLGDVGLYPYNAIALGRAIAHLDENPTPREVLDSCVSTVLVEADVHIESGDYPHERTRRQFDFKVNMAKDALLEANPSSDPERMYRALVIWGNESPLPGGIIDAFSLDGPARRNIPKETVSARPNPDPPVLPNKLQSLFQWQNGVELPEAEVNYYRDTLRRLTLDRLQLDEYLVHIFSGRGKAILDSTFNVTSFAIEGARGRQAGPQSVRIEIARNAEAVQVLAAARWFREHGHYDPTRGKFQWPQGYRSDQLAIALESHLDEWAEQVRSRFIELTGGNRLAQQAVGVRTIALVAAGRGRSDLTTTGRIMSPPPDRPPRPGTAWLAVEQVASDVLRDIQVEEYVGEFAAVRQGESGAPQFIDPRPLDAAVKAFLTSPETELEKVVDSEVEPVLALAAERLLGALKSAVPQEARAASQASAKVRELLEGQSPQAVSQAANDVGHMAREAGVFRPAEKWRQFADAVEVLSQSSAVELREPEGSDLGAVLRNQRDAREIYRLEESLGCVRQVMDATRKECERAGRVGGDLSRIRERVKIQLGELESLVESLKVGPRP